MIDGEGNEWWAFCDTCGGYANWNSEGFAIDREAAMVDKIKDMAKYGEL